MLLWIITGHSLIVCLRCLQTNLHCSPAHCCPADAGNSATNAQRYTKEGDWFEPTYGEGKFHILVEAQRGTASLLTTGPYSSATHVIIPKDKYHLCPPLQHAEEQRLKEFPFKVCSLQQ
jgi:hypothetical protein